MKRKAIASAPTDVVAVPSSVVGDSPWDVEAALAAGLRTVAVLCGGFAEETLVEAGAVTVHKGPEELARLFPSWLRLN